MLSLWKQVLPEKQKSRENILFAFLFDKRLAALR
jgi:hypothetical protein